MNATELKKLALNTSKQVADKKNTSTNDTRKSEFFLKRDADTNISFKSLSQVLRHFETTESELMKEIITTHERELTAYEFEQLLVSSVKIAKKLNVLDDILKNIKRSA